MADGTRSQPPGRDRVDVDAPMRAGERSVPVGEYSVSVDESERQLRLEGAESVIHLPAARRASKMRVAAISVQLLPVAGEPRKLLIVRVPPSTEWVVSLESEEGNPGDASPSE